MSGSYNRNVFMIGIGWLAFMLFTVLYIPIYFVNFQFSLFPFLGGHLSWILASWVFYLLLAGLLLVVVWIGSGTRPSGEEPRIGTFVPSHWARRTGIAKTDILGFVAALILAVLCIESRFWLPWASIAAFMFGVSVILGPVEPWPLQPRRAIPETPAADPVGPGEDGVERSWEWDCRCRPDKKSRVALRISASTVESRQRENAAAPQLATSNAAGIARERVIEGSKDREAIEAARQLLSFARENRFNYFEEAQNTLQLAQVIPYGQDDATKGKEYFRFTVETFYDNIGDCDCKAILASTLFRLMGLRSIVLLSWKEGHAAVAVEGAPDFKDKHYFEWNGGKYYFCETTDGSFGFTVGEVPPNVDLSKYDVRVEIEPALMSKP